MDVNLTSGAISKIVNGKCTENDLKPVLQVLKIDSRTYNIDNKRLYFVWLSDGSFKEYVAITYEIPMPNKLQKGSIVQLTKFQLTKIFNSTSTRYILVCDLNLLHQKCDIIGVPKPLHMETPLVVRSTPTTPHSNVEEPPTSIQNPSTTTRKCSSHSPTQNKNKNFNQTMMPSLYPTADLLRGRGGSRPLPKFAAHSVNIIGFTGNLVEVTNKSSIRPPQNKFGPSKKNALVPPLSVSRKDISDVMKMMVEITNDVRVLYKKVEKLDEDVSKMTRMMMEKNREDDVGASFKKLETLEEDVSKLTRMMMEKNKEDDMGACIEKLDKMGWGAEEPIYDTALLLFLKGADYRKLWLHLKPECCGKWVKIAGSIFGLLD